jgi:hypothetical protein
MELNQNAMNSFLHWKLACTTMGTGEWWISYLQICRLKKSTFPMPSELWEIWIAKGTLLWLTLSSLTIEKQKGIRDSKEKANGSLDMTFIQNAVKWLFYVHLLYTTTLF